MRTRIVKATIFIVFALIQVLPAQTADDKAREAWELWNTNDRTKAEEAFLEALKLNPNYLRARLGLAFLYQMSEKQKLAWQQYRYVIEHVTEPDPYIFSGMHTKKMMQNQNDEESGILDLYKQLSENSSRSIMRANANESLGRYYLLRNELDDAIEYFDALHTIDDWRLIGPFDNISASGFDKSFPPEEQADYAKIYSGKNDMPVSWQSIYKLRHDRWVDFRRYYASMSSIFYGNTYIHVPEKLSVQIRVGTSGSLKIFLNDENLYEVFDENNNDLDTYIIETELQQGWNRLLIKCGFSEISQCNFMVRITDMNGDPIPDMKISSEIQSYPSRPQAPSNFIDNFAEEFFKEKIKAHPEYIENYVLLADCYLRNDKAIEAELTLKEGLKYAPENSLLLEHLIEAYLRGEKRDEISTTYEKLYNLDPTIPSVLIYKFNRYSENEDIEKCEETLNKLIRLIPGSAALYQMQFKLYSMKKLPEKMIEIAEQGYKAHPTNWSLAVGQATALAMTTQKYDAPLEIFEEFSEHTAEENILNALAELYLKATKLKDWEKTNQRMLELYPAGTGFYYNLVKVYYQLQQYNKAEKYMKMVLKNCISYSGYWQTYGQILRAQNRKQEAVTAYTKALTLNPANFDAREELRRLQGEKSIFTKFESVDREELIQKAPNADQFPEDGAVIMLHYIKRVVYPEGSTEYQGEELVRVFNDDGINDYKEDFIDYSGYNETLIVEKAVVIKPDGSEISADIDDNHIVYKSLEANDFIYLKWKIRNLYNGKLSRHFWDRFLFSRYYPVQDIRYALLIPDKIKFKYKEQNLKNIHPQLTSTDEGDIYLWQLKDQPAVKYEDGMPGLYDVGKIIYVSTIPNWKYLVDWYNDLARTKTRSSFEIKETLDHLFAGKKDLSDLEKVQIVYHYITENIKYSSVSFRQSGLIPQEARDVLVNRIGDCKDVATLCIAMLDKVGIKSNYVLVNTNNEGLNHNILPGIEFNHAIVEVHLGDKPLYLDLTAQNFALGSVPYQDWEAFVLPIREGIDKPFYLARKDFTPTLIERKTDIEITEENNIRVQRKNHRTGIQAAGFRNSYRFKGENEQKKQLTESISSDFPNVVLNHFTISNLDSVTNEIDYAYSFDVTNFLTDAGPYKLMKIPFTDGASTWKAFSYKERNYSLYYWPSTDVLRETITIHLPKGASVLELPKSVNIQYDDMKYTLSFKKWPGKIVIQRELQETMKEIQPSEYQRFKDFYNAIVKADQTQLLIRIK